MATVTLLQPAQASRRPVRPEEVGGSVNESLETLGEKNQPTVAKSPEDLVQEAARGQQYAEEFKNHLYGVKPTESAQAFFQRTQQEFAGATSKSTDLLTKNETATHLPGIGSLAFHEPVEQAKALVVDAAVGAVTNTKDIVKDLLTEAPGSLGELGFELFKGPKSPEDMQQPDPEAVEQQNAEIEQRFTTGRANELNAQQKNIQEEKNQSEQERVVGQMLSLEQTLQLLGINAVDMYKPQNLVKVREALARQEQQQDKAEEQVEAPVAGRPDHFMDPNQKDERFGANAQNAGG